MSSVRDRKVLVQVPHMHGMKVDTTCWGVEDDWFFTRVISGTGAGVDTYPDVGDVLCEDGIEFPEKDGLEAIELMEEYSVAGVAGGSHEEQNGFMCVCEEVGTCVGASQVEQKRSFHIGSHSGGLGKPLLWGYCPPQHLRISSKAAQSASSHTSMKPQPSS
jgi:hypothetical protein